MKKSVLYKVIESHWFILKTAFNISKKRVFLEAIDSALYYVEWILFECVVMQVVVDLANKNVSFTRITVFLWLMIGVEVAVSLYRRYYSDYALPATDVIFYTKINQMLYEKAVSVDLKCYEDTEFYNTYMMAIKEAKDKIPKVIHNIFALIFGLISSVVAFILVYNIDKFAIVFIIFPIIGNFLFSGWLNKRVFKREKESIVFERIANYVNRTVHLADYAKEMRMSNVFNLMKKQYDYSVNSTHKIIRRYAPLNIVLFFLFQYFTFTLLFEGSMMYAGYRVLVTGTMTFSQMAIFQMVMHANVWMLLYFSVSVMDCFKESMYIEQIQKFLQYKPDIPEDADGIIPDKNVASIEFVHVWFAYKNEKYILKDINIKINLNETVALVGFNGAGKTTLTKLLLRLYDPTKGEILLNGVNIKEYNLKAYRDLFSCAFQDGKIFADTVKENVLMGDRVSLEDESIDNKRVIDALKLADIYNEVCNWPNGIDTILTKEYSKEGIVLSGGQNQKIIAARAFAKNAPIAIFDEPSSALDPIAEYTMFNNIARYSVEKVLFFISHRLSSVQNADIVYYMENGRIVESGNHKELMRLNGKYAKLYSIQAKNYQASDIDDEDYSESIFQKHIGGAN